MSPRERSRSAAFTEARRLRWASSVVRAALVLASWTTPLALLGPAEAGGQEAQGAETVGTRPDRADPAAVADSALDRCDAAAEAKDEEAGKRAAGEAERAASGLPGSRAADALVIRARILTHCRIPFAGFMRQGALIQQANDLLERALSIDPRHLGARFTLGLNHYFTPAFLGRRDDAIAAFERVIADHGDLDDDRVATAYYLLGELYEEAGRDGEAAAAWRRGAETFPAHEGLHSRADSLPPPTADPDPLSIPDPDPDPVYRLESIVVEASGYSMDDPRTATRLTKLDVYTLPGGTADLMQTFRAMPGVTQVTDGSDLYVRGGDPAESPIYVDGARLFDPGKFETLNGSVFGVLDPSTLRRAYFSSGGFSARYGNALSGIVDIETEGRPTERRLRVGANLTSLGLTAWQPLGARAGLWSTGMLTHTGALLALHGRGDDYPTSPAAFQAMAGLVYEPRKGVTVKASALTESDETTVRVRASGYEGPFTSAATSRLATASIRVVNDPGTASIRLSGGASLRESGFAFGVLDRDAVDRGLTARLDGEVDRGPLQLRVGLEAAALATERDGRVPAGEELIPGSPWLELHEAVRSASHVGGYGEIEARLTRRLAVIAGLRTDALPGEDGVTVDPRLAAACRLDGWTLRVGAGVFSQGRWRRRPDVPDAGTPNGIPLRARHLVAGVQREGRVAVRVEVYLKDYEDYEPDPAEIGPVVMDGRARGLDLLIGWAGTDRISGWLTYSLLDAILELADGTAAPSAYDVTHTLTAVSRLALGDTWELGLTARLATGRPYTPILGAAAPEHDRPLAPVYGPILSGRYPDYRRLDARFTRFVAVGGRSLVLYLEGLNVLDRRNVMGYTYDDAYANPEPIRAFFSDRTLVLGAEMAF